MALRIGDVAPDFLAETTEGKINFHEWIGSLGCCPEKVRMDLCGTQTREHDHAGGRVSQLRKRWGYSTNLLAVARPW